MENFKISSEKYKMDIRTENGECSGNITDPIDLDNKMRVVYRKRVESAQQFRHSVCLGDIDYASKDQSKTKESDEGTKESTKPTLSGMGAAMERLRSEMVSLVDQDVSFMKQMLMMNERIEEIKSRKSFYKPKSHRKYSAHVTRRVPETTTSDSDDDETEDEVRSFCTLSKSRNLYRATTVQNLTELFSDCDLEEKPTKHQKFQKSTRDSGYYESDVCYEEFV